MTARSLAGALRSALGDLEIKPRDEALVALARRYAAAIDADAELLPKLGPLLQSALESLGMSPRGRAVIMGRGERNAPDVHEHGDRCRCLPCQRKRRALRRDRAEAVHPASG